MSRPYIKRKYLFFTSVRLVFRDRLFLSWVKENKHSMIVLITQSKLDVPKHVEVKKKKTANVDLNKEPEEILQNFSSTTRNEVRRTFRRDELSFKRDDKITDEIFSIYKKFRKDKGLFLRDKKFLQSAILYTAYFKGEPISFITVYERKPYLRIQNIFSNVDYENDKEMRKILGYSAKRLVYEITKFGSKNDYEYLDMAGVNLDDPKKQGITKFKMSFGGELVDEYTYTYKSLIIRQLSKWKK